MLKLFEDGNFPEDDGGEPLGLELQPGLLDGYFFLGGGVLALINDTECALTWMEGKLPRMERT